MICTMFFLNRLKKQVYSKKDATSMRVFCDISSRQLPREIIKIATSHFKVTYFIDL